MLAALRNRSKSNEIKQNVYSTTEAILLDNLTFHSHATTEQRIREATLVQIYNFA